MNSFKLSIKTVITGMLIMFQLSGSAQSIQGRRPTQFPDLPQLTDSTLLFTQDSVSRESYKFRLQALKGYLSLHAHNGISGNGLIQSPLKLGGSLVESTHIFSNSNSFGIWNGSLPYRNGVFLWNYSNTQISGIASFINGFDKVASFYTAKDMNNNISAVFEASDTLAGNYKGLAASIDSTTGVISFSFGTHKNIINSEANIDFDYNDNTLLNLRQNTLGGKTGYHGSSLLKVNNKSGIDFLDITTDGKIKIVADTNNTANKVLGRDINGFAVWRDVSSLSSTDSAVITSNAVSGAGTPGNPVRLGGTMSESTIIDGNNQIFTIKKNKRFFINQSNYTNNQIDQASIHIAKSNIFSEADNDTTNGLQIVGKAIGSVSNTIGVSLYGENNGNGTLSGGTAITGRHTGNGINTIGTKILGENVKGFGVWIEGKTNDTANVYSDIYIRPVNGKMIINNLATDNAAPQVLAKNASGLSVWRDVSSLNSANGILNINNTNATVTAENKFYYVTSTVTYTLTLPVAGIPVGTVIHVLNYGTKALTLSPGFKNSSSTTLITSLVNTAGSNTVQLLWNGTNWLKL